MKVVIVIDMPEGCCECNMAIDLCHGTIPSQEWYDKRPDWCPLIPLPKGCRLIDANEVEKITYEEPYYHDIPNVLTEIREKVQALPTVIEIDRG